MHILIVRSANLSSASGTFGALSIDGLAFCAIREQPWDNNIPGHSCIPEGEYRLLPYDAPAHGARLSSTKARRGAAAI